MKIRVYFNRSADAPYVWSTDDGDISTEQHHRFVKILDTATAITRYEPHWDNVDNPRAWIEVTCDQMIRSEEGAILL